ncbi:prolyl aminopeptidase [Mycoplasmopsis gallopavonis]|uniref:prolyl aminopeptidase n=1 Tax=Mycoplasmopsis gallopavonis TaxID=76629 RepID=UPI0015FFDBC3|nr:prolyl aminopeptidase [Mycoplasmopsis gallopavonis]
MLFNQINPYQQGYLQVDEIHQIYYEVSGNPNGLPILYLHGGPGGSFSPQTRQLFDPSIYKIILFDQRGAGKSLPFAELKNNTTFYLVSDIEKLREHLKIDQWVIFGGSWGTTLGLVYAINHPQKVLAMLLRGVFLAREEDVDFLYEENGASIFAPDYFAEYQNFINKHNPGSDKILNRYYQLFINPTIPEELRKLAIKKFSNWESSIVSVSKFKEEPYQGWEYQIALLESHYFVNKSFLPSDNYILENTDKIKHLPIFIAHGRQDIDTRPI